MDIDYLLFRISTDGWVLCRKPISGAILYMGVVSLVLGNFLYVYYYMIGCVKREQDDLVKYVFLVPVYWMAMSLAAYVSDIPICAKTTSLDEDETWATFTTFNGAMRISIIVPAKNEEGNIEALYGEITDVMRPSENDYELIFVSDGSRDFTWKKIEAICHGDKHVRGIEFGINFGKAAALQAGFDLAQGEKVIQMDADLQDDPKEIPNFIRKLDEGFDIGCRMETSSFGFGGQKQQLEVVQ